MAGLIRRLLGDSNEREIKRLSKTVDQIEALEPSMKKLSDRELKEKTTEFKNRYAAGETLEELLPEAFAVVREASVRVLGMRHFNVQLLGGIVLHQGRIAEMKTGEGKTLAATLPAYLNALTGKGVHIVTVNDYLARRDSEWMGKIYRFLGLSVGLIAWPEAERRAAMQPILLMVQITNSALIICGITWSSTRRDGAEGTKLRHCGRGRLHPH